MQFIAIPEFPRLRGEEAIAALHDFVNELEEENQDLTDKQAKALIRFTKGLISSIEAETRLNTTNRNIKEMRFTAQLKQTITKHIPEPISRALRFA